jgi:tripartite-type tricarboxylate transporter receptor subunit TctC
MNRRLTLIVVTSAIAWAAAPAVAQQAPASIRLVVPTPAGGPSDAAARVLAQAWSKSTGQTIVVENVPGAGGAIAARAVIGARPDGRTLLWGLASMTGIPLLQKSAPFQSLGEFTPVSLVGRFAFGMFVHPQVPARTVAEFVAYARANPDTLNCANGTLGEFMAAAQFMKVNELRTTFVPYKGGAQLMPDLINGRVNVNFGPVSSGLQHVKAGRLRMLATLAPRRTSLAPDVPTLAEAGVVTGPLPTWQAIFATPKTPQDIANRLSREIAAALQDPAAKVQLDQLALQLEASSPQALAAVVAQDVEAWRAFVHDNNVPQE